MNTSPERQCHGKVQHGSKRGAQIALHKLIAATGDFTLDTYRCPHCLGWHVGHPARRIQRKLRTQRLVALIEKAVKS